MRNYSWYTIVHPDYEGWPAPPLYLVVNPDGTPEEVDGHRTCSIEYKPNRKGGYNRKDSHLLNVMMKKIYGKNEWRKKKRHYKFCFYIYRKNYGKIK